MKTPAEHQAHFERIQTEWERTADIEAENARVQLIREADEAQG